MKVRMWCEDFKKAVDRAMVVLCKKSSLPVLRCVKVAAENDLLIISASDTESFVKINVDATVLEPGVGYIMADDIKKIYRLVGNVTFEISNGKATIINEKKKSSVLCRDFSEEDINYPETITEKTMEISEKTLVDVLSDLSCFLSTGSMNPLMNGYYFEASGQRIVALNGHIVGIKRLNDVFTNQNLKCIVPGFVFGHLKKIADVKRDGNIDVFTNNKFIMFSGTDFTYWSKLIDGDYYNIDKLFGSNYGNEFELDAAELGRLAKEYKKCISDVHAYPMYLYYNKQEDTFRTGVITPDYMTADILDGYNEKSSYGLTDDFIYSFTPEYIMNITSLFKDNKMVCKGIDGARADKYKNSALVMENDVYTALILPWSRSTEQISEFLNYISEK